MPADGALPCKVKELIAIAISQGCQDRTAFRVAAALGAGASPEEISDTVQVAVMMGGGPAAVHAFAALRATEELSAGG